MSKDEKKASPVKTTVLKKDELITKIAEKSGESKSTVVKVVDAYPEVVMEGLIANLPKNPGDQTKVMLPGFGAFGVTYKPAQTGKNNFGNGETWEKPARFVPIFKATSSIQVVMNKTQLAETIKQKKSSKAKSA